MEFNNFVFYFLLSIINLFTLIHFYQKSKKLHLWIKDLETRYYRIDDFRINFQKISKEQLTGLNDQVVNISKNLSEIKKDLDLESSLISHKETIEELRNSFDEITDELNKEKSTNRFLKDQLTQKGVIIL